MKPTIPPCRREETSGGGAMTESTRTNIEWIDETTFWATWSLSFAGMTVTTWIELARWTGSEWKYWVEGCRKRPLCRWDCPVELFSVVPAVDWEWRDRCWEFAENQVARNYKEPVHAD